MSSYSSNRPRTRSVGQSPRGTDRCAMPNPVVVNPYRPETSGSRSQSHPSRRNTGTNYRPAPVPCSVATMPMNPRQPYAQQYASPAPEDFGGDEDYESEDDLQANESVPQWCPNQGQLQSTCYNSLDEMDDEVFSTTSCADCGNDPRNWLAELLLGVAIILALLMMLMVFACILYFIASVSFLTLAQGCGWYLIPFLLLMYLYVIPYLCSCG